MDRFTDPILPKPVLCLRRLLRPRISSGSIPRSQTERGHIVLKMARAGQNGESCFIDSVISNQKKSSTDQALFKIDCMPTLAMSMAIIFGSTLSECKRPALESGLVANRGQNSKNQEEMICFGSERLRRGPYAVPSWRDTKHADPSIGRQRWLHVGPPDNPKHSTKSVNMASGCGRVTGIRRGAHIGR